MTTTVREYLANKGLAKANARGKFSTEAHAALKQAIADGVQFSDWDSNGRIKVVPGQRAPKVAPKRVVADVLTVGKPVRVENTIRVVDKFGYTINVDHCANCCNSVRYCHCAKGPWLSDFLFREAQDISFVVRNTV